jgi:hypothetical protein
VTSISRSNFAKVYVTGGPCSSLKGEGESDEAIELWEVARLIIFTAGIDPTICKATVEHREFN